MKVGLWYGASFCGSNSSNAYNWSVKTRHNPVQATTGTYQQWIAWHCSHKTRYSQVKLSPNTALPGPSLESARLSRPYLERVRHLGNFLGWFFIPMTYEMSTKGRLPYSFCYCFGAVTLHLRVQSWTAPQNIFWHIIRSRISHPQCASAKKQLKSRRYLPPPLLPAAKGAEVFRLQLSNFRFAFHRRGGVILVLPAAEDCRNHRRAGGSWKKWHGGRWGAWSSIHDALAVDMFSKMGTKITIFIGSLEKGE